MKEKKRQKVLNTLEKKNVGRRLGRSDSDNDNEKPSTSNKSKSLKSGKIYMDEIVMVNLNNNVSLDPLLYLQIIIL